MHVGGLATIALVVGLPVGIWWLASGRSAETAPTATVAKPAADPAEDARVLVARATLLTVRQGLRNPDSLVVETLGVTDDAKTVCMKYRAQNGFGGMNVEYALYRDGKGLNTKPDAKAINTNCKSLNDYLWVRRMD